MVAASTGPDGATRLLGCGPDGGHTLWRVAANGALAPAAVPSFVASGTRAVSVSAYDGSTWIATEDALWNDARGSWRFVAMGDAGYNEAVRALVPLGRDRALIARDSGGAELLVVDTTRAMVKRLASVAPRFFGDGEAGEWLRIGLVASVIGLGAAAGYVTVR